MCTVSIRVNESAMHRINHNLTDSVTIGRWLQRQVDLMIEQMVEEAETMSLETAREKLHEMVRKEYALI